jgi:hypothetical protein
MRSGTALLLAAVLLASFGCGGDGPEASTQTGASTGTTTSASTATTETGTTSTGEVARCDEEEGVITGYLDVAERDCGPVLRLEALFRADRLSTGSGGTVEFDTRQISGCKLRPEAAVLIRPDAATALRLLAGTIACDAETGGEPIRLEVPGAELEVTGTLFTLTAGGDTTSVKVHEGAIRVLSTAEPEAGWRELTAGGPDAAAVVSAGEPLSVVEYRLEDWEPELLQSLKLGIVTLPAGELPGLTSRPAMSGSVVTDTEAQGDVLKEQNLVRRVPLVTTAELAEQRRQFVRAGDTVVGVGSFSDLVATFAGLREAFGSEVTLVYTPFAFPEEEEEETTTETSTDSTETGPP